MDLFSRKRALQAQQPEVTEERPLASAPAPTFLSVAAPAAVAGPTPVAGPAPLASGLRLAGADASATSTLPPHSDEAVQDGEDAGAEDMRNLPLGTLLYRHGLVQEDQLAEALGTGIETGDRLGDILIRRGLVSEDEILRMIALQRGLQFLQEDEIEVDETATSLLSAGEARELSALPVRVTEGVALVVSPSPSDDQRHELERRLDVRVEAALVSQTAFERLLAREHPDAEVADAPGATDSVETAAVDETGNEQAESQLEEEQAEPSFWTDAPAEEPVSEAAQPEPPAEPEGEWQPIEFAAPEDADEDVPAEATWVEHQPGGDEFASWSAPAHELVEETSQSEEQQTSEEVEAAEAEAAEVETAAWDSSEDAPVEDPWHGDDNVPVEAAQAPVADGRIDELGAQHEASVGRIHQLLGQIEAGASTFTDLRRRLGELGESLHAAEESVAERERRLEELGQARDDDQRRIDELVGQLRERDEALGELGGRVEDLSGRLVTAEERLTEGAARVEELFRQVALRDEALASFADKLDELAGRFATETE